MKTLLTIATLVAATSASADYHTSTYDWNNDAATPVIETTITAEPASGQPSAELRRVAYAHQDNGVFGYNPYNIMDPRWMMEEMSNIID
jgi:hypothetical protein